MDNENCRGPLGRLDQSLLVGGLGLGLLSGGSAVSKYKNSRRSEKPWKWAFTWNYSHVSSIFVSQSISFLWEGGGQEKSSFFSCDAETTLFALRAYSGWSKKDNRMRISPLVSSFQMLFRPLKVSKICSKQSWDKSLQTLRFLPLRSPGGPIFKMKKKLFLKKSALPIFF